MNAAILIFAVLALIFAVYATLKARSADEFAGNAHKRANDTWGRISRIETAADSAEAVASKAHFRLDTVDNELFRSGEYPDLGVRDWARKWRKDLRDGQDRLGGDIASLYNKSQDDVSFLAARIQFLEDGDKRIAASRRQAKREAAKAEKRAELDRKKALREQRKANEQANRAF